MALRHFTVATTPDDPAKEVSTGEWNEAHTFTDANIGALLVRGASSDLVAGVSSVAVGQVLISQGVGSVPAWSATPIFTSVKAPAATTFEFGAADTLHWRVSTTGQLLALGNYNIGDGAGSSPDNIFAESSVVAPVFQSASGAHLNLRAGGTTNSLFLHTNGADRIALNTAGTFYPVTDAANQLGGTSNRWTQLFLSQGIVFSGYNEGAEIADPAAPAANAGRLYFKDNGAGKSQLAVRFATGAVQIVATEP